MVVTCPDSYPSCEVEAHGMEQAGALFGLGWACYHFLKYACLIKIA